MVGEGKVQGWGGEEGTRKGWRKEKKGAASVSQADATCCRTTTTALLPESRALEGAPLPLLLSIFNELLYKLESRIFITNSMM